MLLKSAGRTAHGGNVVAVQWRGGRVVCTLAWGSESSWFDSVPGQNFLPGSKLFNHTRNWQKPSIHRRIHTNCQILIWNRPNDSKCSKYLNFRRIFQKRAKLTIFDHDRSEKFCSSTRLMKIFVLLISLLFRRAPSWLENSDKWIEMSTSPIQLDVTLCHAVTSFGFEFTRFTRSQKRPCASNVY